MARRCFLRLRPITIGMKLFLSLTTLALLLFGTALLAGAQQDGVTIVFNPAFPRAGDAVTAKALLSGTDIQSSYFEWYKNGKAVSAASGKGKNEYSFQMGVEQKTTVDVLVITADDERLSGTKTATLEKPSIVWWTDTSVPIWYKGKAQPSPGSNTTFLAIPGSGFGEGASNLLYSWNINAEVRPDLSGISKDHFTVTMPSTQDVTLQVNVRITNSGGTISQEATVLVPTRRVELAIYQLFPTGGTDFSKLISVFSGEAGESYDFTAVPFFFRSDQIKSGVFTWKADNKLIEGTFDRPGVLTLKTDPGQISQSFINVLYQGAGNNAQEAESSFSVNFQ